jgi:hypothetical protein
MNSSAKSGEMLLFLWQEILSRCEQRLYPFILFMDKACRFAAGPTSRRGRMHNLCQTIILPCHQAVESLYDGGGAHEPAHTPALSSGSVQASGSRGAALAQTLSNATVRRWTSHGRR